MVRRAFLIAGLFLLAAATVWSEPLRVLTFNVRYPSEQDGQNRWEQRRDLLVQTIKEAQPDLIGTQELFKEQGNYIVEKLPEYSWFGVSRRGDQTDEHMGVFYRKERFRLADSGHFWLSETPDKPGSVSWNMSLPRMVTWGYFEESDGRRLYFYNTHFPHRGTEDAAARVKCAQQLAEHLRMLPEGSTVILTGDFNTDAASEPHKILTEYMQDAWTSVPEPAGPSGTFHNFSGKPASARIDWVLFKGALKPVAAETITRNNDGHYPSDHFPVLVTFEWK